MHANQPTSRTETVETHLRFLAVLGLQNDPDAVQQVLVALLFVLTEGRHESLKRRGQAMTDERDIYTHVAHGASGTSGLYCIRASLRVLAATPRYHISGTGPGRLRVLVCFLGVASRGLD